MPHENASMWNLKHDTHAPIYETDAHTEHRHAAAGGGGRGGHTAVRGGKGGPSHRGTSKAPTV